MRCLRSHPSLAGGEVTATAHGALGALAEILGLYILLVAGTNVLPVSWRIER
jgi:hypothetical protein